MTHKRAAPKHLSRSTAALWRRIQRELISKRTNYLSFRPSASRSTEPRGRARQSSWKGPTTRTSAASLSRIRHFGRSERASWPPNGSSESCGSATTERPRRPSRMTAATPGFEAKSPTGCATTRDPTWTSSRHTTDEGRLSPQRRRALRRAPVPPRSDRRCLQASSPRG